MASDPRGAYSAIPVVRDHNLVTGDAAAELQGSGDAGYRSSLDAAVMGRVDVDAYSNLLGPGMQRGPDRAEAFGQHTRGATMQQPKRLLIALDRHGADDSMRVRLEHFDAQPLMDRHAERTRVGPFSFLASHLISTRLCRTSRLES